MGKLSIYHLVGDSDGEMEGGRQVEVILGHRNSGGEAGRKDFERRTQQKYKSESRDNLIVQRSGDFLTFSHKRNIRKNVQKIRRRLSLDSRTRRRRKRNRIEKRASDVQSMQTPSSLSSFFLSLLFSLSVAAGLVSWGGGIQQKISWNDKFKKPFCSSQTLLLVS